MNKKILIWDEIIYEEWPKTNCGGGNYCKGHPDHGCSNDKSVEECKKVCNELTDCTIFAYQKSGNTGRCCTFKPSCTTDTCRSNKRTMSDWSIYAKSIQHIFLNSILKFEDKTKTHIGTFLRFNWILNQLYFSSF